MDTGKQLNANELIAKLQELEKENARLRKILDVHGIPYIVTEPNVTTKESLQAIFHTDSKLSLQEKVALFRSVEKPLNFDPFGHARFAHLFVLYD